MQAHEEAIVRAFILRERQERYLALLGNPRRRKKALDTLNHAVPLDPRFMTHISGGLDVAEVLRARGAPDACYVLSAIAEIDGCELPLEEAVREAEVRFWGTIIGCIPGRLAFYLGEGGETRAILERAK